MRSAQRIVIACDSKIYYYFEDYCQSLKSALNYELYLYHDESVILDDNSIYLFMARLPASIIGLLEKDSLQPLLLLENELGKEQPLAAETAVVTTETAAVTTETAAVTTETAVVTTETAAVTTETAIVTTETAAVTTETAIVTTETAVVTAETAIVTTETAVVTTETAVVTTETAVVTTETAAVTAKTAAVTTETAAVTAETVAVTTETVTAESYKEKNKLSKRIYVINTEQLSIHFHYQHIQSYKQYNVKVIDYDCYQSTLTDSIYLPYQIINPEAELLSTYVREIPKSFDVVFCGLTAGSERRNRIYESLSQAGVSVLEAKGFGAQRDQQIASARILINVHYRDDYKIHEHFRCDRWVLAGMLVVSEDSLSDSLNDLSSLLVISAYDELAATVTTLLKQYDSFHDNYQATLLQCGEQIRAGRDEIAKLLVDGF